MVPRGLCGCHGNKASAGWRFGNIIDGTQAEYVLVPDAQANLAPVPDGLTDEQVLMCPDIMSTGFKGAENAGIRIGDTRSEEHTSELQSLMRISYAVFCLKKKKQQK